ncbi:MFS transporter [uncultured Paludibaculum sp.]|uniref:MFS transporter n=1 Tax=uncultured Paludibaculum sp. TaxID=1765020 RepID=UPI002AABBF00|nr:MFS transporter [uncultured Paludibaculum sp.]
MRQQIEAAPPEPTAVQPSQRRWWIVWALFGSTVLNYFNRQTLSVLAPLISQQLHLSHSDLSRIFAAFQVSYAVMWLVGGIALDIVGTRLGLSLAVVWWSLVSLATSFANSVASFGALRFLLGIGEGFNWPGASKTVAEVFPPQERGLAVAIFDSGSSVGGALAAFCIPWIALKFGWRSAFAFSGILGFAWMAWWLLVYPRPVKASQTGMAGERAFLRSMRLWIPTLKRKETWAVVLGRSLTDPVWWFYVFWLPQYLSDARGFSLERIALFAWIPFVAADAGNFAAGFVSGRLIRRGMPVMRARKLVCVVSCVPMLGGIPAASVQSPFWALALICLALFGYASWSTMGLTLPSDLFPPDVVGSVTGLSGLGAGAVSTLFTLSIGVLVDRFSYGPAFVVAGIMPLLATLSILALIRPDQEASAGRASA